MLLFFLIFLFTNAFITLKTMIIIQVFKIGVLLLEGFVFYHYSNSIIYLNYIVVQYHSFS